jgi:hypothetical protein
MSLFVASLVPMYKSRSEAFYLNVS